MMSNLFTTNMLIAKEGASENCLAISGLQCSPTKKSFKRQKNPISLLGPSSLPEAPFILEIIRQYLWSTRSDREKEKKNLQRARLHARHISQEGASHGHT